MSVNNYTTMTLKQIEEYDLNNITISEFKKLDKVIKDNLIKELTLYGGFAVGSVILRMILLMIHVPDILCFLLIPIAIVIAYVIDHGEIRHWIKQRSRVNDAYYNVVLQKIFPGATLNGNVFEYSYLRDLRLLPKGDTTRGKKGFVVPDDFNYQEYVVKEKHEDSDGHSSYTTYFEGFVMSKRVAIPVSNRVRIITSGANIIGREQIDHYPRKSKEELKVDVENVEFNKIFEVYAKSEQDAFYVISPYVTEKLLELRKICDDFQCIVTPSEIYLAVDDGVSRFSSGVTLSIDNANSIEDTTMFKQLKSINKLQDEMATYLSGGVV